MDVDVVIARAVALVEHHLERLNAGDLAGARATLFEMPEGDRAPIDAYLEGMRALAPFTVKACAPRRYQPMPRKMHGIAATVWVGVVVDCAAGERRADLTVWWYPDNDKALMTSRPTAWLAGG